MLGVDALGRLALGQASDAAGATNYLRTLTANVAAAASKRKQVILVAKRASLAISASVSRPVNRVKSASAGVKAAAVVSRRAGSIRRAGVTVLAMRRPRSVMRRVAAGVQDRAVALKSIVRIPMTARASFGAVLFKNVGKPFRVAISAFALLLTEAFNIISRRVLHEPVDYFMEGLPQYREQGRTYEGSRGRPSEDVKVSASGARRLSATKPTFTTTTGKRGYD